MCQKTREKQCEKMIEILKNVKKIVQKMQLITKTAEENETSFLPQMAKINKTYSELEVLERRRVNETYLGVYNILLEYYVYTNQGSCISLQSDVLLKEEKIGEKILLLIEGQKEFEQLGFIIQSIAQLRKEFKGEKEKIKKISSRNKYFELEEIFDYIGTLKFDNECTMSRFIRAINKKIKILSLEI